VLRIYEVTFLQPNANSDLNSTSNSNSDSDPNSKPNYSSFEAVNPLGDCTSRDCHDNMSSYEQVVMQHASGRPVEFTAATLPWNKIVIMEKSPSNLPTRQPSTRPFSMGIAQLVNERNESMHHIATFAGERGRRLLTAASSSLRDFVRSAYFPSKLLMVRKGTLRSASSTCKAHVLDLTWIVPPRRSKVPTPDLIILTLTLTLTLIQRIAWKPPLLFFNPFT